MSRLSEIRDSFSKSFGWQGDKLMPVDFALSAWFSTYLTGDRERPWSYLIGGPSSGKTEILKTMRDSNPDAGESEQRTVYISDFTENAFASGYRSEEEPEKDPSILARLDCRREPGGNKVLVVPDMGNILGLPPQRRVRFFNQMRSAYDKTYDHSAGNIGRVYYNLNFGFIAAATEKLDDILKDDQPLGSRMVICRMNRNGTNFKDDCALAGAVIRSNPYVKDTRLAATKEVVQHHLKAAREEVEATDQYLVQRPEKYVVQLEKIHTLLCRIRTVPVSNQTMTLDGEKPPRVAGQLTTWGDAHAALDGRRCWNDTDMSMMRRIAQDTLNPEFLRVLVHLWGEGPEDALKGKGIDTLRSQCMVEQLLFRQFRQWDLAGLVSSAADGSYKFRSDIVEAIHTSNFFEGLDLTMNAR